MLMAKQRATTPTAVARPLPGLATTSECPTAISLPRTEARERWTAELDAKATSNEPAKAFIKFISAPAAAAAYKAKGLDPG